MKHALAALLWCLAILLGTAGTASGAYVDATSENRVGVSGPNPDIRTYVLGSLELEPQRGDTILGYDPATGVVFYVRQNPWTAFDPLGLSERKTKHNVEPSKGHHKVPVSTWDKNDLPKTVQETFNKGDSVIKTPTGKTESHNYTGHGEYNKRVQGELDKYIHDSGHPGGLSAKQQKEWADGFIKQLDSTEDKYIKGFNNVVGEGRSAVKGWAAREGSAIVKAETSLLKRMGKVGGKIADNGGRLLKVGAVVMTVSQFAETAEADGIRQAGIDAIEQTINPIGLSSREMKQVQRKSFEGFWDSLTEGAYDNEMKDQWNTLP